MKDRWTADSGDAGEFVGRGWRAGVGRQSQQAERLEAAAHGGAAAFAPCREFNAVPAAIDNIFLKEKTGACLTGTFGKAQQSDHIGLAALCILKKQ